MTQDRYHPLLRIKNDKRPISKLIVICFWINLMLDSEVADCHESVFQGVVEPQ